MPFAFEARGPDSGEEGVVLAVVAHHGNPADPGMVPGEFLNHSPTVITAAVIDEQEFKPRPQRCQRLVNSLRERLQRLFRIVHRYDYG
jgi:hypothetical protein